MLPIRFSKRLASVFFLCALFTSSAVWADATLVIERVETDDFLDTGSIRIFADLLKGSGDVIPGLDAETLEVYIDDKKIEGTFEVQTFSKAGFGTAVGILVAAHNEYNKISGGSTGGVAVGKSADVLGSKAPLIPEKEGFAQMVQDLKSPDVVTVWYYTSDKFRNPQAATQNYKDAAEQIGKIQSDFELDDAGNPIIKPGAVPSFLAAIRSAITSWSKSWGDNPKNKRQRNIFILMSDGLDKRLGEMPSEKVVNKELGKVISLAKEKRVKIWTIGYTTGDDTSLTYLQKLSSDTGGVYRNIPVDTKSNSDMEAVKSTLGRLADQLHGQYVITFTPTDYSGSEEDVKFRIDATTPVGKESVRAEVPELTIPKKPFDWVAILKWVGIILGSLLGLFLLFKLISAFMNRDRGPAPVEVEGPEGPTGPYKGKLVVQAGDLAGYEFYLTEDVTTIGSIEGNTIVLSGAGISKRHAGIKIEDMRFELADFGSTNGTYVNGNKITKQFLRDQDEISIGDCEMRFTLK